MSKYGLLNQQQARELILALIAKGYPENSGDMEFLVDCVGNQNSLYFDEVINFLKSVGEPVIPYFKKALKPIDIGELQSTEQWMDLKELQMVLVFVFIPEWPKQWVEQVKTELQLLAYEGDLTALEILIKHGLGEKAHFRKQIKSKIQSCDYQKIELERLRELLDASE
jgi:hypothetical protein